MSTPIEIGQLTRLELGYVGETGSRDIQVDMTTWLDRWPEGAIAILVRRPVTDEVFYLAATEVEGSILTWTVTETDVAVAGRGMAQISIYDQDSRAVYKSRTVQTIIKASIDETLDEDASDPMDTWVAHAAVEADRATSARQMAAAARDEAVDAAEDAKDYAAAAEGYASRAESAANEAEGGATQAKAYALRAESAEASAETSKTSAAASAQDAASSKAAAEAHKTAALGGAQRAEAAATEAQGTVDGFADTVAAAVEEISASKQAAVEEVLGSIPEDYMTLVAEAKTHAPGIVEEISGDVAVVTDAAARDAVAVVSTITAVQEGDGDPSATNIRPITGWSAVSLWHGAAYDASAEPVLTADLPEVVYGGTLDWVSGVLTVTHRLVDADSVNWKLSTNAAHRATAIVRQAAVNACTHYPRGGTEVPYCYFRSGAAQIAVQDPSLTTLEDFTAFFAAQKAAGTPVQFLIEELPENQTTIQLTPHQLTMLRGSNALWSDTGYTNIAYVADTQTYVDDRVSVWERTGFTIAALGDSIMAGDGNGAVGIGEILAERIGGACWKYAKGGATITWDAEDAASTSETTKRQNIQYQVDRLIAEHATAPDIILLEGGVNDIGLNVTLGEVTATYEDELDTSTFAGAMESLIKRLKNAYPGSVILYIRAHRMGSRSNVRQTTFGDMAVEICDKWSVGLVDVYNRSGLNTWMDAYHQYTYNGDKTHPTQEGYERFYIPLILAEVKRHIGEV